MLTDGKYAYAGAGAGIAFGILFAILYDSFLLGVIMGGGLAMLLGLMFYRNSAAKEGDEEETSVEADTDDEE